MLWWWWWRRRVNKVHSIRRFSVHPVNRSRHVHGEYLHYHIRKQIQPYKNNTYIYHTHKHTPPYPSPPPAPQLPYHPFIHSRACICRQLEKWLCVEDRKFGVLNGVCVFFVFKQVMTEINSPSPPTSLAMFCQAAAIRSRLTRFLSALSKIQGRIWTAEISFSSSMLRFCACQGKAMHYQSIETPEKFSPLNGRTEKIVHARS